MYKNKDVCVFFWMFEILIVDGKFGVDVFFILEVFFVFWVGYIGKYIGKRGGGGGRCGSKGGGWGSDCLLIFLCFIGLRIFL